MNVIKNMKKLKRLNIVIVKRIKIMRNKRV